MTAANALAHAALMADDRVTLDRALDWAVRGTSPILQFMVTGMDLYRQLFESDFDQAAHTAMQYWTESVRVPIVRAHQASIVTIALLETGRIAAKAYHELMNPKLAKAAGVIETEEDDKK